MTESSYSHWGRKHCIQYTVRINESKVPPFWKKKYYWLVFQSLLFLVPRWTLLSLGKSSVMLLGNLSSMDHCKDSTCTDLIRPYPEGGVNLVQSLLYIYIRMSICMHVSLNYKYSTMFAYHEFVYLWLGTWPSYCWLSEVRSMVLVGAVSWVDFACSVCCAFWFVVIFNGIHDLCWWNLL